MCRIRKTPATFKLALMLGFTCAATTATGQYRAQHHGSAPQGESAYYEWESGERNDQGGPPSRSLYARQGQFASRTSDYTPAWRVHPNVRPSQSRTASRGGVRQVRHQQEVLEPPFGDDDSGVPPFDDAPIEAAPAEQVPTLAPAIEPEESSAPVTTEEVAPVPRVAPPANGRRAPTPTAPRGQQPASPRTQRYEEIPPPPSTPRPQQDFEYEMTDEYAGESFEEGGEYYDDGTSACPECGQFGEYCECGPPHVCNDTWPCWHARRQWRHFRLFGGGWDIGCPWNWWDELSVSFGPHAFKGPLDQGQNGNFGFQEAVNWGGPLWHCHGIGYQLGAQGVHSNFAGDNVNGGNDDNRNQVFVTAGLFARAPGGHGWQVGVVFDWLEDDYYVDVALSQLRAELSYVTFCGSELGAWIASSSESDTDETTGVSYEVTDMYALFFRHCMPTGGEGRIWGGGTADGNGLVGADFRVPLNNRWSLSGAVNYVIPQDGANTEGLNQEAWGITMNLVWHPFRSRSGPQGHNGPYRPLFSVADNNMFMVDRELTE